MMFAHDHTDAVTVENKFALLQKWIALIQTNKIRSISEVKQMRFQRLLSCKEWRALSTNISIDYDAKSETLRYWVDVSLYQLSTDDLTSILTAEANEKERAIEQRAQALISYYCFDEFMSFIDIRRGFMPLIRGVDGEHILDLTEKCKKEFGAKKNDSYILETFCRDSDRLWIFSNNAELMRLFKIKIFNLCKSGKIFYIEPIFRDLVGMNKKFYLKPGMLKTRGIMAKIYANGTELFVVGKDEEERQRGCNWIESMLREWKINFIGSELHKSETMKTEKEEQQISSHIQTEQVSDFYDSNLIERF